MCHLTMMVSVLLLAVLSLGQQLTHRMSNQDVIDMVSLGLSDDVVIDKIHATDATDFDTSVAGLKTLKLGKVSDAVIRVMINPHANTVSAGNPAAASPVVGNTGLRSLTGVKLGLERDGTGLCRYKIQRMGSRRAHIVSCCQ